MKRKIFTLVLAAWTMLAAFANDGVYTTSGNFLVPIQETDISVAKEILTITIGKENLATVEVYYEFLNRGTAKTVTMAFEADAPYNSGSSFNRKGAHPFIGQFTVEMNGEALGFDNAVVAVRYVDGLPQFDVKPIDVKQWKSQEEMPDSHLLPGENFLYNARLDSTINYGYGYYFKANFKPGRNIVRHTYNYLMSYSVSERFSISYWLTPAMRWANRQIDDFTLKIAAEEPTEFCLNESPFHGAPFKSTKNSKLYDISTDFEAPILFATASRSDTITWHARNFRPKENLYIWAPTWERKNSLNSCLTDGMVVIDGDGNESLYIGVCGDSYFVLEKGYRLVKKSRSRLEHYDAANGKGWLMVNSDVPKSVNVRQRPTTRSAVVGTIEHCPDDIPEAFTCLGLVNEEGQSPDWQWFKLKVNGKVGYVRQDMMIWNAICPF